MAVDRVWGDKVNQTSRGDDDTQTQNKNRQTVILDTNGLLMLFQFHINLESELDRLLGLYNIVIPSVVINELSKLSSSVPEAKAALKLAQKYNVLQVEERNNMATIDDVILDQAHILNAMVVTNDKELRKKLKQKGLTSIYLRAKSYLKMD